ncbi:ABC-type sulfonate transport system periplasmic component [uncultured Pleomorphomonas sp.]|uniref:ABC-type sulfonate transport system periplasmic component n=2 Tax=uncultured Pleomorphomonas sp. TaxID=442121 RepID=A0A212LLC6_9HYPH|nr:ABC-type sulfonate transport system periplasmic component [uncultured Pleomorphomonas sp.]
MTVSSMPRGMSRRRFLECLAAAGLATLPVPTATRAAGLDQLTVWGMPASPSVVLARAVASGALAPLAGEARFDIWRTADQMRAGVVSGDIALFAAPSYAAANLFNRGAGVRLVNILTWGLLYIFAGDGVRLETIGDLKGKTLLVGAKNDAPDLLTRFVLKSAGLEPGRDVGLSYVGTSAEAVPLLLAGKADAVVLPEPAASAAEIKAKQANLTVTRALDVTDLYAAHSGRPVGIPQAGLAVTEAFLDTHPDIVAALHAASVEAAGWVGDNPKAAAALVADPLKLPAPIIEASLPRFRLKVASALEAKADLEAYFEALMTLSPDIVAGRLPDPAFYWGR